MKTLITGCNGLLGQRLIRNRAYQEEILGIDLTYSALIQDIDFHYKPLNLCDRKPTIDLIKSFNPELIIHAAAMTNVDKCELEKEACWQANVFATDNIVTAANYCGSKIIFISTDYVFDGISGPYTEEDIPNPIGYYGKSKLAAENLIRGSGVDHVIIRTIVLYGVGIGLKASFVGWLINELRSERVVHIVTDQRGNTTLADDLVRGIDRLISLKKSGIYHIGGSEHLSRFEFAVETAKIFGLRTDLIKPITTDKLNQPAKRPLLSGLDTSKAEAELFISFYDLKQSLALYHQQDN
jgi:dTDP-4-dehydrorhamnose reductase